MYELLHIEMIAVLTACLHAYLVQILQEKGLRTEIHDNAGDDGKPHG